MIASDPVWDDALNLDIGTAEEEWGVTLPDPNEMASRAWPALAREDHSGREHRWRMAVFEEHLRRVLPPDELDVWTFRLHGVRLESIAAINGTSAAAVLHHEDDLVDIRIVPKWERMYPTIAFPVEYRRR